MKRSSVLSRVFFRRAAVKALVPDLKLVLVVLTIGCESHVGVYRPAGLGEDTGLDPSSLAGALNDLERRCHILPDSVTGEIFILAWFRDNSFSNAARRGQARDDFAQIESPKLRLAVLKAIDQNPSCGLNSVEFLHHLENQQFASQGEGKVKGEGEGEAAAPRAPARGTAGAAPAAPAIGLDARRRHPNRVSGIECWYPSEDQEADAIVAAHDSAAIQAAVSAIKQRPNGVGKKTSPVPALVLAEIECKQRNRETAAAQQNYLQDQAARQCAAEARTTAAHSYFQSLEEPARAALLEIFAAHLSTSNAMVFQFYRREGLKPKSVDNEFATFVHARYLAKQEEVAI